MQNQKMLHNGNTIPLLGLGTWKSEANVVGNALRFAVSKAGYRHIDCASIYGNEKEIGETLQDISSTSVKRKELFITSKLWNTDHRQENVEKACKKTLADLRLDYLDLYLMHWGIAFKHGLDLQPVDKNGYAIIDNVSIQETWNAMENLVKKGLVRSIGVANFTTMMLIDLLTHATMVPVVNQIELHPYNTQTDLIAFCEYKKIAVTAYSPLGRQGVSDIDGPKLFAEPTVKKLAKKYRKKPAQILLNWALLRGTIVIPKSTTPERIQENANIFDFALTANEHAEITSLNRNHRFVNPASWWHIPYFV